jgi:hypothetical protein
MESNSVHGTAKCDGDAHGAGRAGRQGYSPIQFAADAILAVEFKIIGDAASRVCRWGSGCGPQNGTAPVPCSRALHRSRPKPLKVAVGFCTIRSSVVHPLNAASSRHTKSNMLNAAGQAVAVENPGSIGSPELFAVLPLSGRLQSDHGVSPEPALQVATEQEWFEYVFDLIERIIASGGVRNLAKTSRWTSALTAESFDVAARRRSTM